MPEYKLVIFDLDGTILNTIEDLKDSANYALSQHGYAERSLEEIRSFVGNGIKRLIERCLPEGTEEAVVESMFTSFNARYKEHCMDKTCHYDGTLELLEKLREQGIGTAVLSNKADYAVKMLCEKYFKGLFDSCAGMKEDVRRKPWPDGVFNILNEMNVKAENAVYIGDSEVDLKTAANAGIDCIAVDWGFRDREALENEGAKLIASDMDELYKYIKGEV